jgi:hypothetical protein
MVFFRKPIIMRDKSFCVSVRYIKNIYLFIYLLIFTIHHETIKDILQKNLFN